jgi:glycerate-2-kinase
MPRNVVAIGKCAGALLDGFASVVAIDDAFAAIPKGYPPPQTRASVAYGGHPEMDLDSFRAGEELLRFVDAHRDITFLISGGGSACVEVALPHLSPEEVIAANHRLIAAGLPIAAINRERAMRSAIKGGRLGARVRGRVSSLIYSDVSTGDLASVASGPALLNPILIADNGTLVASAAIVAQEAGADVVTLPGQLEGDVSSAIEELRANAAALRPKQILIAGGEPTVVVRGKGKGGRCSELALRFAMGRATSPMHALFASSDGVDGNSGAAGIVLELPASIDPASARAALEESDSFPVAARIGRPIIMPATGNNLRDLYLVACC